MLTFEFSEMAYNFGKNKIEKVADWAVIPCVGNRKIIVQKITPDYKRGDSIKKVFRVEDTNDSMRVMKTKIKAAGGAEGLVEWLIRMKSLDTFSVIQLLNPIWDTVKQCL